MINLIPHSAKKNIITEYWVRVLSVWLLTCGFALICSAVALFPSYILVSSHVTVYEESAAQALEKVSDYESANVALVRASQQAREVVDRAEVTPISQYVDLFTSLQGDTITVSQLGLNRQGEEMLPVQITGSAINRQSLASFRDRLLAQSEILEVDLPISNLANDKDIPFSITVTMANQTDV